MSGARSGARIGAVRVRLAAAGALSAGWLLAAAPAHAAPAGASFESFQAGAMAPVMQITEDAPSATFHPQGDGDYEYSLATADTSRSYALSTVLWPGGAAGNAGSLVGVLGGPSASVANDPVRAEATSGTPQTSQNVSGPSGTQMSASVVPSQPGQTAATAKTSTVGGSFGPVGSTGASTTSSTLLLDPATNQLTATAVSHASDLSVAGVVRIGSVTSTAIARSAGAASPTTSGLTSVNDMTIAGQPAYVDGSGVHLGQPGKPAPPGIEAAVNSALAGAGMSIYFTDPHTILVGGVDYYYAGSVLFFWKVPSDPNQDSFTMSIGGSAVSMGVTAGPPAGGVPAAGGAGTPAAGHSRPAATTATTFPPSQATPASETTLSLPSSGGPPAPASPPSPGAQLGTLAATGTVLPGGLGAWWAVILLGGLLGSFLLPRVPTLLGSRAAAACPRAPDVTPRPARRSP